MKNLYLLMTLSLLLVQCGGSTVSPVGNSFAGETEGSGTTTPSVKSEAIMGAGGAVIVDAGFAGNGTIIAIPTGFTASECKFTAAAANIDGSAISTYVSVNTTTGEVVCEKVVQERTEVPPVTQDCVASYTMICTR